MRLFYKVIFLILLLPLFAPVETKAQTSNPYFTFNSNRLTVSTPLMETVIERAAIVYVKDKASGEVIVNSSPWTNNLTFTTEGSLGFSSTDASGNVYKRWPGQTSTVTYSLVSQNQARLTYSPLYIGNGTTSTGSQLILDVIVDTSSGEITLQSTGIETDTDKTPSIIDIPIMNFTGPAVILGSGSKYLRTDPAKVEMTRHATSGLYNPTVAVIEGNQSVIGYWSESTQLQEEYMTLFHYAVYDHVVGHATVDYKQRAIDSKKIISPSWRLGTYPTWGKMAKRWKQRFEVRTGALPLWQNRSAWVRSIHAVTQNTLYFDTVDSAAKLQQLANLLPPNKLLYFIWNGSYIVLFGDHTLVKEPWGRPTTSAIAKLKSYGWPFILYHPWDLIYTEAGRINRLAWLNDPSRMWVPTGYIFKPDYAGYLATDSEPTTISKWNNYWSGIVQSRSDWYNGYDGVIHPGSEKFQNYFPNNFINYCNAHSANGSYLDTLGFDMGAWAMIPTDKKVMDGRDFVTGQRDAIAKAAQTSPNLGMMSEYQATETVPYTFYTWDGLDSHVQNTAYKYLFNHPLRTALTGSYTWTRENSFTTLYPNDNEYYKDAALFGTLPEVNLAGDSYNGGSVSDARVAISQARAKLFSMYDLFNDVPDVWDPQALAYYRSNTGHWFKFKPVGSTYAYIEEIPGGQEITRLSLDNPVVNSSPAPSNSPVCPADLNKDKTVNLADIVMILGKWNQSGSGIAEDLNGDGKVNLADLQYILTLWGQTCQ